MNSLRIVLPVAAWAAAMYGVLQIRHLTGTWDHAICGPWGCGPPLSSLAAYHGFWFVLLAGGALLAARTWSRSVLRYVGFGLVLGAGVGLVALTGCLLATGPVPVASNVWQLHALPHQDPFPLRRRAGGSRFG